MERLINRRQQGDLGELSAMEWLTRQGATVFIPVGHSPDVDLVAMVGTWPLRIQVKTSTCRQPTPNGHERWSVAIRTNGGNQSWTGTTKFFDPSTVDYLFVLVGDGRRWLIPSAAVESVGTLNLGGTKYSEFEIDRAEPILHLVLGEESDASRIGSPVPGEYSSGQRGDSVKVMAMPSQVRILPPPSAASKTGQPPKYESRLATSGQAVVWQKRRLTIPQAVFAEGGLEIGDRVRVRAEGPGRLIIERIEETPNLFEVTETEPAAG